MVTGFEIDNARTQQLIAKALQEIAEQLRIMNKAS